MSGGRRGSAMVEFCIGSGVLMAAFSGTFELGYSFIQYNKLLTAVAEGARYAAMIPYDSMTVTPSGAYLLAVRNMVVYGAPVAGGAPVVSELTTSNVVVTVKFTNGVPGSVAVSITGYPIDALFRSFTLTGKPQVTFPYQGVWAPA
jgi:hypothetical protein